MSIEAIQGKVRSEPLNRNFSYVESQSHQAMEDSGYAVSKVEEIDLEIVNVKNFGAVGDGQTDDTNAIIDAAEGSTDRIVYFPSGEYRIEGEEVTVDVPLRLVGNGDVTFTGDNQSLDRLFDVRSDLFIDGITFRNLPKVFDLTNAVAPISNVTIINCRFIDCGSPLYWISSGNASVNFLRFDGNHMSDCLRGVYLWTHSLEKSIISRNVMEEIGDRAILVGKNEHGINVKNTIVTENHISGLRIYGEGKDAEQEAILVYGDRAIISNNTIEDVKTVERDGGEAIYTKCRNAIIANNVIRDIGDGGGSIIVKGDRRAESTNAPHGYGTIVRGNILYRCHRGISIHNGDVSVESNYIDDVDETAIDILNDELNNVSIVRNKIFNVKGRTAIRSRPWGRNIVITDNIIDRVTGEESESTYIAAIEVDANESGVDPKNYLISRNSISDVRKANGRGIVVSVLKSNIRNVNICGNMVTEAVERGIAISGDAGLSLSHLYLYQNQVVGSATAVTLSGNLDYPDLKTDEEV